MSRQLLEGRYSILFNQLIICADQPFVFHFLLRKAGGQLKKKFKPIIPVMKNLIF
jgi:hypothetical protein